PGRLSLPWRRRKSMRNSSRKRWIIWEKLKRSFIISARSAVISKNPYRRSALSAKYRGRNLLSTKEIRRNPYQHDVPRRRRPALFLPIQTKLPPKISVLKKDDR